MKRSKNRKDEIYAVAASLFRKQGYVASTMRDIAELVGIEASSLYSHIKSKEEILITICTTCAEEFDEGMQRIKDSNLSNPDKIDALIDLHLDIAYNKPSSVTVFDDEWRHLPEKELKSFLKKRNAYEANFKSILKDGMEKGEFVTLSDSTAFHLIINCVKWVHYYSKRISKDRFDSKRSDIKSFISRGLFSKMN
ncbi:MAG: TetR family transcriptional regulator [Bacteroidota bacterium]